jgi:PAS domain S-box-containing protein
MFLLASAIGAYSLWHAYRETGELLTRERELNDALYGMLTSDEIGYAITDESGNIVEWNPALVKMTGISEEKAKRDGIDGLMVDGEARTRHWNAFHECMAKGIELIKPVIVVRCSMLNSDGNEINVMVSIRRVESASGRRFLIASIDPSENVKVINSTQRSASL